MIQAIDKAVKPVYITTIDPAPRGISGAEKMTMTNHPNRRRVTSKLDAAMWLIIDGNERYTTADTDGRKIIRHAIKRRIQEAFGTAGEIEADSTVTVDAMVAEYNRH